MSKIVLIGDSITAYMPYIFKGSIGNIDDEVRYFGVENIGVGTYMQYVWPRVDHENVDIYILLIGINNIFRPNCDYDGKETLEDLVNKLKEFISQIINKSNSKLLVQSIYPTRYIDRVNDIKTVNKQLEVYCSLIGAEYLDLYSLLVDDEELFDKRYSNDGIHPNGLGYSVIAEEINKKIKNKFIKKINTVL